MDSQREAPPAGLIAWTPMLQNPEVQDASDDWTGVTSTKQRKRLQNRLNQRAYRKRKQAGQNSQNTPHGNLLTQNQIAPPEVSGVVTRSTIAIEFEGHMLWPCRDREEKTLRFARRAIREFSTGCPSPVVLPNLIRLNVLNAITQNAKMLGFDLKGFCADEFISPFNQIGPGLPASMPEARYPVALRPTSTQLAKVHHPWSDLIPIPGFRDNLLRAIELGFDDDLICVDLLRVEEEYEGKASLIVWGAPWDTRGWEASVEFIRKWGWLLKGCTDIIESTNYWRQKRGEKRIKF